jgi:hypothetical protein
MWLFDDSCNHISLLDDDSKSIVRPFMTTKFCIAPRQRGPPGALPFM